MRFTLQRGNLKILLQINYKDPTNNIFYYTHVTAIGRTKIGKHASKMWDKIEHFAQNIYQIWLQEIPKRKSLNEFY